MKNLILFITAITLFIVSSCNKDNSSTNTPPQLSFSPEQAEILQSSNQFGMELFRDLADDLPGNNNLFISPLSVYLALTMTYNGAATKTATDMQNTLGYGDLTKEEINQSCKDLVNIILHADPKVTMEIANSIWYRNTVEVKQNFILLNQNYFDADVKPSDFNDQGTVGLINNWVKDKTHKKIDKVINEISPNAIMYLINAIYFKGTWKYTFDKTKTTFKPFYLNQTDTAMVPFMEQTATINYFENDLLEAIELPYGNKGFSMVVLVPKDGETVNDLIASLSETNWQSWNSGMNQIKLKVLMPRFKFSYDTLLNESLKTLGMSKAFSPNEADFTNIADLKPLFISFVLHKSFVDVNEDGTEAAAVTVVGVETTASPIDQPKTFIANKPFIFAIKENTNNTILFSGLINKPVSE